MDTITSRQNRFVRECRELATQPDPSGTRLLLDGVHLVRDARAAGCTFEFVGIAASRLDSDTEERELSGRFEREGVPTYGVTESVFSAMSPVRTPSGIVAVARRTPLDAAAILGHEDSFVVVAVDVQDPGNIGALIRVAEAGGATGLLVSGASADPFSWKALRGSMGSALRLPVAQVENPDTCVANLRAAGFRTVAAIPRNGRDPDATTWTGRVALVLGGEGQGLPDAVSAACDEAVTIPMATTVESLNVAVAAGILIYAARSQRPSTGAQAGADRDAYTRKTHRGYK